MGHNEFTANGEQCLNCLSQQTGQVHLIFGNPKVGTPWMVATPSIAIDLPMKILVAEDPDRKVWVSYNDPGYIQARHHLPPELFRSYTGAGVDRLAAKAAE